MSTPDTAAVSEAATAVAEHLREDGLVVVPRSAVNRRVKEHGELDAIDHGPIRDGFADAGWDYDRHLYLDVDAVEGRTAEVVADYRAAGRVLAAHEEVAEELAGPVERGDEAGWTVGQFPGVIRRLFEEEGWLVERIERGGARRTLFLFPLAEHIAGAHPNGRPPLSTDDLLRL